MVNHEPEAHDDVELEVTNEENSTRDESELADEEARYSDKVRQQREKIRTLEQEKKQLQDEVQRTRADFLNAKRRLEEERARDHIRHQKAHGDRLLPLCDSFQMAMQDTEAWEKTDPSWRKGVEAIHAQLQQILNAYGVHAIDPVGDAFDPIRHEAVSTEPVEQADQHDTVVAVLQRGYELRLPDEGTELIRPARVVTGVYHEPNTDTD